MINQQSGNYSLCKVKRKCLKTTELEHRLNFCNKETRTHFHEESEVHFSPVIVQRSKWGSRWPSGSTPWGWGQRSLLASYCQWCCPCLNSPGQLAALCLPFSPQRKRGSRGQASVLRVTPSCKETENLVKVPRVPAFFKYWDIIYLRLFTFIRDWSETWSKFSISENALHTSTGAGVSLQ